MGRLLYQLLLSLVTLVAAPILLLRRRSHYASSVRERLGFAVLPGTAGESHLWIHAVSVGEVGVAATLAPHIRCSLPLMVTTVTPTGQETARKRFPNAVVAYLPFDLEVPVRRFFNHFRPRMLLLTEGDMWPTVLHYAHARAVPVVVVNGRVSERSFQRMRRIRSLLGPLLDPIDRFGVQTEVDRSRLLELGVPENKVQVTGNLKFDSPEAALAGELAALISRIAGARPVLIAGSTMAGEEEQVLEAFSTIGGGQRALLVLAPRHPERWQTVAELLDQSSLTWTRRSEADAAISVVPDVVLLDTLGELAGLYKLGRAAFIGGTLSPTGGHNPLEAACFGVPVAVGPSMDNFREIESVFDQAEAWERVTDAEHLARCWISWLDNPKDAVEIGQRGSELVARHRGALDRTLELIAPWLPKPGESA